MPPTRCGREARWYHEPPSSLMREAFCMLVRDVRHMTTGPQTERRLDQIPKTYEPGAVEQRLYRWWEESGYFKPRENPSDPNRQPFVISMPPPNVTGALHLGHAITATLEDLMIRYHRMRGDLTLWVPGEDHAG